MNLFPLEVSQIIEQNPNAFPILRTLVCNQLIIQSRPATHTDPSDLSPAFCLSLHHPTPEDLPETQTNEVNAATCRWIYLMLTACKSLPSPNTAVMFPDIRRLISSRLRAAAWQDCLQLLLGIDLGDRFLSIRLNLLSMYECIIQADIDQPCWELPALGFSPFLFLLLFTEPD